MHGAKKQLQANGSNKLNSAAEFELTLAPVCTSEKLGWRGFRLERYFIAAEKPRAEKMYSSHLIGIALGGKIKNVFSGAGDGRRTVSYQTGDALLCPAGFAHTSYEPRESDLLLIYLEPEFIERAARDLIVGEKIEIAPQLKLADPFISDAGKHLLHEAEAGGTTGVLYAESLMTAIAVKLIKNYSTARLLPAQFKGGLAKHKLRRVVEYINENLGENLSLNALARLCDLSVAHFASVFKQSTGFAPHRFVNLRRIERGRELLENSSPPSVYQAETRRK